MQKSILVTVRILSDFFAFAAVVAAIVVLEHVKPHKQGYFATDINIMHPYKPEKVPNWMLYTLSVLFIISTVIFVELAISWDQLKAKEPGFPEVLVAIYNYLTVAFFGYCLTITFADMAKATVGRPRPSFLKTCKPKALETTVTKFVKKYTCQAKEHEIASIKSFPSMHAAVAMFTAIYLCIYLQLRQPVWRIPAFRLAYQALLVCLGLLTAVSRLVDNKEHPSDVIIGGILGFLIAFTVPCYIGQLFPRTPENEVRRVVSRFGDSSPNPTDPNETDVQQSSTIKNNP